MEMNSAAAARDPIKRVLIIDPNARFSVMLRSVLGKGYAIEQVATIQEGAERLSSSVDVVLLNWDWQKKDAKKAGESCQDLLKQAASRPAAVPVVGLTSDERRETAMQIIAQGAYDIFTQPLNVFELKHVIDRAHGLVTLTRALAEARGTAFGHVAGIVGNSKPMQRVYDLIQKVAGVSTTVLISGESGTGKEVVARAIHRMSPRAEKAFMAFSPSALPESLIEDELFGHEAGAFTGAAHMRRGRFEEAKGGTVFLDEIGDLPLPLQAKLLRVLQERSVERLGSNVSHPIDVRVICATSRNLEEMVQKGTFREDLYFRVSVVRIHMPPLRERVEDIPLLAEYFLKVFAKAHNKQLRGLTPGFLSALARHSWPGNVRELQNVIERSLVLANGNDHLGVKDLPQELRGYTIPEEVPGGTFHEAVRTLKRELVRSALRMHSGNKLRAAKELGISRCYLHRLVNQLDIPGVKPEDDSEENEPRRPSGVRSGSEELRMGARAV